MLVVYNILSDMHLIQDDVFVSFCTGVNLGMVHELLVNCSREPSTALRIVRIVT